MSQDDIEGWVAGLRGKSIESAEGQEGQRVRELVVEVGDSPIRQVDEQAWQRLLFRLRAEGLIRRTPVVGWPLALAASLVVLGLGVILKGNLDLPENAPGTETWRGEAGLQVIVGKDPVAVANRIQGLLESRGLVVRRVMENGAIRLQAQIDEQDLATFRALLAADGVDVPPHGRLDLLLKSSR